MLPIIIFLSSGLFCLASAKSTFSSFDYCQLESKPKCKNGATVATGGHPACHCTRAVDPPRDEPFANDSAALDDFRQELLNLHNDKRNHVASGKVGTIPAAADMMVVNWDPELEHVARCRLLNSYAVDDDISSPEPCSYTSQSRIYGQNVYFVSSSDRSLEIVRDSVEFWYVEVKDLLPAAVDRYPRTEPIYHISQLVWSTITHMGCARTHIKLSKPIEHDVMVVMCNYRSRLVSSVGVLTMMGQPVYKKGESCSACPDKTRCETERFPALCGRLLKLGTEEEATEGAGRMRKDGAKKDGGGKDEGSGAGRGGAWRVVVLLLFACFLKVD